MQASSTRSSMLKWGATAALLAAVCAFNAERLAGAAGVTITPIEAPTAEVGIGFASPAAAAVAVPSAPDAWGGVRTGSAATLSDRVVDYQIAATLDPVAHTIDGRQKLRWRNRSAVAVRSVYVHLYMNAFESAGSTFFTEQRRLGGGFRSDVDTGEGEWGHIELRSVTQDGAKVGRTFVHPDNGPETDRTVVRLDLSTAVAPGATTTLEIDFHTKLPRVVARTGHFGSFHLVGQWFPKIGVLELPGERGATAPRWNVHEFHLNSEFYADFGNFDVKLTVPRDYRVGATGALQGAPVARGGMLTHHYVQGDVHDFAWTADRRFAAPLEATWTGPGSPNVKVSVLYPPEYEASAAPAMRAALDSLAYFSRTLGPYPYTTLTVVIPPFNAEEAGGMEYPTFITASGYDKVPPKSAAATELDFVTIHEFGHGYFYGILASNEFEEPMLDEGLNEYWNQRMLQERGTPLHIAPPFVAALGINPAVGSFALERMRTPREEPADPLGQNAYNRLQGIGPAYSRTATVMRDLEARIGKQAMERAFKAYYQRWKFRHPSVADLRESLAEASGERTAVEQVFAQQVYQVAKVDDRIDRFGSAEELPQPGTYEVGGKRVEHDAAAVEKQIAAARAQWAKAHPEAKPGTGPFPFRTSVTLRRRGASVPQTLVVKFADGSTETAHWNNDEKWQRLSWIKPARAVSAELDPQRLHYLDTSKLDDSRTLAADPAASRRWGFDFAAFVQIVLSLIANV
ncbi:M1 family metallopeptidase [Massilia glaciei]|uniref:M1 family metallopeptidase n=1 Tax=Massilia glaciei TaxID=1524097 RepID=UPI0015E7E9B9|nr:M1 family metallopeptidase [Massilia glaciei]